jgi:hypothetical protein
MRSAEPHSLALRCRILEGSYTNSAAIDSASVQKRFSELVVVAVVAVAVEIEND